MKVNNLTAMVVPPENAKMHQSLKFAAQGADKKSASAAKVAKEFEALFVGMMLKGMRETVGTNSITGGGKGEEVYRSLLDQEYANVIAENGSLGLATMLEKQLTGNNPAPGLSSTMPVPDK
jgi:flagellar protein FlgJ